MVLSENPGHRRVILFEDLRRLHAQVQRAKRDTLTQLGTRDLLTQDIPHLCKQADLRNEALSCIFLDVDHFKTVNDTWGHTIGDRVLQRIAHQLQAVIRDNDRAIRYGGEEFLIVLPHTSLANAHRIAERMRKTIAEREWSDLAENLSITISAGIDAGQPWRRSFCDNITYTDWTRDNFWRAVAHVAGAALGDGDFHHDDTVFITHDAVNCESRQVFKKVLRNGATGVFQGKILVKEGAQKTDGYQISQSLLLDDDSQFLAKPELEIYADDVICSHGSTSSSLDKESLFYLLSRGVHKDKAKEMLISAFISEALDEIEDKNIKTALSHYIDNWTSSFFHE